MEIGKIEPQFSVVIPLYNKADTILRTLRSVIRQEFRDFEIVVVDDGSKDNSAQLVESFDSDVSLHLIRQTNAGVSFARNRGVAESRGRYTAFLDADDEWHPEFLLELSKILLKFPNADVIGTDYAYIMNDKIVSGKDKNIIEEIDFFDEWPWRTPINSSSMAIHRDFFVEMGGFNTNFRFYEDAEFLFRLALKTKFCVSRRVLSRYNTDANHRATGSYYNLSDYPHWRMAENLIENGQENKDLTKCVVNDLSKSIFGYARRINTIEIKKMALAYPIAFSKLFMSNIFKYKITMVILYPYILFVSLLLRLRIMSNLKIVTVNKGVREL